VRKSQMEEYSKDGEGSQTTTSVGKQSCLGGFWRFEMVQDM
jgi:hypothetical protein